MNPIPLTDPAGAVAAYLCGRCHHLGTSGGERMALSPDEVPDERERQRASSLAHAEACCLCDGCQAPLTWDATRYLRFGRCHDCQAKETARLEALAAEERVKAAAREATLEQARDRAAAEALLEAMRDISDTEYMAGWLDDLEFLLWHEAFETGEPGRHELRTLGQRAGGWFRWDTDLGGEVFVTLEAWRARFARAQRTPGRLPVAWSGSTVAAEPSPVTYDIPPGATVGGAPIPVGLITLDDVARAINADPSARVVATLLTPGTVALTPPAQGAGPPALPYVIADDEDDAWRIVGLAEMVGWDEGPTMDDMLDAYGTGEDGCAGCGRTEPPDASEAGWRSVTMHDGSHRVLCPNCQRTGEGPERGP